MSLPGLKQEKAVAALMARRFTFEASGHAYP